MATAYISRTLGTPTNAYKGTFSAWVKRGTVATQHAFFSSSSDTNNKNQFYFTSTGALEFYGKTSSVANVYLQTTRLFRDPGAWYHIVLAWDTEQVTDTDRVKLYVNGTQYTWDAQTTQPAEDAVLRTNVSGETFMVGASQGPADYWDGDMSWVQFVDGLQLAPTEFGSVDSTSGIWKIKPTAYGTPGTNGFCLKMEDRSNLDLDTSSNAHTMTTSGTLTATYDNPSNNFCTMNPLINRSLLTYSNGNNTIAGYGDGYSRGGYGTMAVSASKWYYEFKVNSTVPGNTIMGIGNVAGMLAKSDLRFNPFSSGTGYSYGYKHVSGDKVTAGTESSYGNTWGQNDIMSCAIDLDNLKIYFGKNGTWQDSGDPTSGASGTGAAFTIQSGEDYLPAQQFDNGPTIEFNFGNGFFGTTSTGTTEADDAGIGQFKYDVPAGYYAICTKNIKAYGG